MANVFRAHSSDYQEADKAIVRHPIVLGVSAVVQVNRGAFLGEHDNGSALVLQHAARQCS